MSPKNFNDYQSFTKSLAAYNEDVSLRSVDRTDPDQPYVAERMLPFTYPSMALAEEAGEVLGKIAKYVRKSNTGITDDMEKQLRADVGKELGDLLYQVSETARQFGYTLQEIVDMNYDKLKDRQARGVLVGEGDAR